MVTGRNGLRHAPPAMIAGFALLLAMVFASLAITRALSVRAAQSVQVLDYGQGLNLAIAAARDAESGQRGYLLTGDRSYLAPYSSGLRQIETARAKLRASALPRARANTPRIERLLDAKMSELAQTVRLYDAGRQDDALGIIKTNLGRDTMARLREIVDGERAWTRAQTQGFAAAAARRALQLTLGLILGLVAIVLLTWAWLRQARVQVAEIEGARRNAESALAALTTENAAREAAESQLRQLQKMESLGQLTGGVAHDFNNMLAVVIGGLELAKRRLRSDPERAEACIDNAREGATRAAALTARLLAFSRASPLAPRPTDLNKLVSGMSELLVRSLGDAIRIETVLGAGLWRCYADAGEVENALLNLAVNARDAMDGDGRLTIETANSHIDEAYARTRSEVEPGQYVTVCVTDTGSGMPPDVIERAFDPFFTTKPVGKGTGLGLSQVFGFAKQSGGHVAIYSEVGEGTTVKLYLPRYLGDEVAESASAVAPEDLPTGAASEIILVVEDEQRVRHFAVDVLRELGYTTISAASPAEALRALEQTPGIAMLFTDIVMPDMNGRRLAELATEARPGLKVLYTTGYTRNAVVHNGMLDIGVAFLPKPYTLDDLARKVRDVLDGGGVNRRI